MGEAKHETRAVFLEALALTMAAERARFLDAACRDKPELRQRVEALLRAREQVGEFLTRDALGGNLDTVEIPITEGPGTVIGRYKLLEQIGEGGFGVVFMAEQVEPIRRRVALKIVKPGMDTKQVIARFEAERQALAIMDHPNIARVFDAGATETGRPYFVMELVNGVPLTQFCDTNNLTPRDRLKLFLTVCEAVQHAHQKGIIHRDLKPSNILVTLHDGKPVPKVIDFGTAKALQQSLTEKTLFTAYGKLIGTPQYMSPEQAEMSGLDVDTRADIYALGVLLYELLTGTTPFEPERFRAAAFEEMLRIIREEDPPKPSTRVSTLGNRTTEIASHRQADATLLRRALRGDLDWIVMKALEKDRTRRYETASALVADIQHHLSHEPVLASPPGAVYLARKFVRRHRIGVAFAAVLVVAVGLGLSAALLGLHRARQAESGEKVQRQRAEELAEQNRQAYLNARLNLYAADMVGVRRALDEGNLAIAQQLLAAQRPKTGEPDLRGIEWPYFWKLAQGDQLATLWVSNLTSTAVGQELSTDGKIIANSMRGGLDISPDGKLIAASCVNGTIHFWDMDSHRLEASWAAHNVGCADVAFAPTGRVLASCGGDEVKLWEVASRKLLKTLPVKIARHLAFSPDGKLLAIGTTDTTAPPRKGLTLLCATDSEGETVTLPQSGGYVLAFSEDGKLLATGPWEQKVKVWDVASRQVLHQFQQAAALSASFDRGHMLVTGGTSPTVKIYSLATGKAEEVLPSEKCYGVDFSPDGAMVASAEGDGTIRLWNWRSRELRAVLRGHQSRVMAVAFTPDGQRLVSGGHDGSVRIWSTDTASTSRAKPILRVHRAQPSFWDVVYSGDGKWLAARSDQKLKIVDVRQSRVATVLDTPSWPLGFLPDNQTLVSVRGVRPLDAEYNPDTGTAHLPTTSASAIELWNWRAKTNRTLSFGRDLPVSHCNNLALSPDGAYLALAVPLEGGASNGVLIVNMASREVVAQAPVRAKTLRFSPDSRYLGMGWEKTSAWLWQWSASSNLIHLPNESAVRYLAFSPDGKKFVTLGFDVRFWEVPSGKPLFTLSGYPALLRRGCFSADGRTFAAVCDHESSDYRLWHLATRRELLSFPSVREMEFAPDNRSLALVTPDSSLMLIPVPAVSEIDNLGSSAPMTPDAARADPE